MALSPDVVHALMGDSVDFEAVAKMGPDPSGVHVPGLISIKVKRRRQPVGKIAPLSDLRVGRLRSLTNALGIGGRHSAEGAHAARVGRVLSAPAPESVKTTATAQAAGKQLRDGVDGLLSTTSGKVAAGGTLGTAYLAGNRRGQNSVYKGDGPSLKRRIAEGVGLGATAIGTGYGVRELATEIPHAYPETGAARAATRLTTGLSRMNKIKVGSKAKVGIAGALLAGDATATAVLGSGHKQQPALQTASKAMVDDVTFGGAFSKFDNDKKQAFGWASVVELNGEPVVDRQGDYIGIDDIEEAAYAYIRKSRVAGDMHRRTADDEPFKAGEVIESVVFTKDKCQAMGLPMACAGKWWIGVQVDDEPTWEAVKKQARTGFSIHGKGLRKDTSLDEIRMG